MCIRDSSRSPPAAHFSSSHAPASSMACVSHRARQSISSGESSGAACAAGPPARSSGRAPPSRSGSRSQVSVVRQDAGRRSRWAETRAAHSVSPSRVPPVATYSTSGKAASRRSASADLPLRAPPSTSVRRGRSGTAWYSPTSSDVPSGTVRAPAAASRRCSSGPGGTVWSRWTPSTSVAASTAPLARSRASASGRPRTSSRTMSYGRTPRPCPSPSAAPAGAAPGGRYSSRSPSAPPTS